MSSQKHLLEVCVASITDAITAAESGADRLELNLGLEVGGLTPDSALVRTVTETVDIPVIVMIRPRAAGFRYSSIEQTLMLRAAEELLACGAAGIATGCLTGTGEMDTLFFARIKKLLNDADFVCHRVFDVLPDRSTAIRQLIDSGVHRILTSGGEKTAWAGRENLAELQEQHGHQIEILPGSGITPDNLAALATSTGCHQFHGSFSTSATDPAGTICSDAYPTTSASRVQTARQILDELST